MRSDFAEFRPWLAALRPLRGQLWLGGGLLLATLLSGIGLLTLSGWFITATGVTALAWALGQAAVLEIYVPGAGIRTFALTRTVARYGERILHHNAVLYLLAELRVQVFTTLTALPGRTLRMTRSGDWLARLINDIDALDNLYLRLVAPTLVALLSSLGVSALIAVFMPWVGAVLALTLTALVFWLTLGTARHSRHLAGTAADARQQLRLATQDSLHALGERVAAGSWPADTARLARQTAQLEDMEDRLERTLAWRQAMATAVLQAATTVSLLFGLQGFTQGQLTAPVAVMLAFALLALNEGLAPLTRNFAEYGKTLIAARRLNHLSAASSGTRPSQPRPSQPRPGQAQAESGLSLLGLSYRHPASHKVARPLLQNLDLHLEPGEQVGIIGESGSGKSTLADLITGVLEPDQGTRQGWPGLLAADCPPRVLAYLTQETALFNDSLRVNLLLGAPHASDKDLMAVLTLVELADLVRTLPDGLDSSVGNQGQRLSGGEARRLALARVILAGPRYVVLDEPFTGVDPATRSRIKAGLADWCRQRTLVVLAHHPDALLNTERTLQLHQGQLIRLAPDDAAQPTQNGRPM